VTGSALIRNAVAPSADDAEMARAASRTLKDRRDWSGPVSLHLEGEQSLRAPLPKPAFRLLIEVLSQMARGNVVAVTPIQADLTTQQAAELLGVSRPHLVKLLEGGHLPFRKVGAHRRVQFADLAAYRAGAQAQQRAEHFMKLNTVEEGVRAIANGEMIIVVDDDDQ
jgi:excisionase family DNA binding protein